MTGASTLALPDTWLPLGRSGSPLLAPTLLGPEAARAAAVYDYSPGAHVEFAPWLVPAGLPSTWGIGLIVGGSGSGKSTLLREFGAPAAPVWDSERSIADHFPAGESDVRLNAVGLSSVPAWTKSYDHLSNGERFRADLARCLEPGARIDEFTSVVDRVVAQAASRALRRWVDAGRAHDLVLATCHRDVVPWVRPDWIIDTDAGLWCFEPRECLQRPPMVAEFHEVSRSLWVRFMGHHYLTADLHPFARCYLAVVEQEAVAFAAAIPFPHGRIRNGWRGTRLVTLPDYQGLGIGPRLADWVAEAHVRQGYSYYAKTTHPRLGAYRDAHPNWQATSHSGRKKPTARSAPRSFATRSTNAWVGSMRPSYSHRYLLDGAA